MTIEPPAVGTEEDRALAAFTDREVDGSGGSGREWDDYGLAALAQDRERAVTAFEAERLDVRPGGFGDSQPVECEQADQRVVLPSTESGCDEHGTDLVAVQPRGV